jgi:hypothetical protein
VAIYHLNVKNISRGDGRSVVAAAAYRAGETLPNEAEERLSDFSGRRDVVAAEIRLPANAPEWMRERALLWGAVEVAERRKDARLAKEVEFALMRELPRSAWLTLARQMADAYTGQGFVVDLAIHDDGTKHNPHVHLLLTTRVVTETGFGPKIRSADGRQFVTEARTLWERIANETLKKLGIAVAIDSRSFAKRKLDRAPGQHRGPDRAERQERRQRLRKEVKHMRQSEDDELPVPDPDGRPIHPRELAAAESRMLDDMRATGLDVPPLSGDIAAARAEIEHQNGRELSEDEASAYKLAPDNQLDWLGDAGGHQLDAADMDTRENHLDWLENDRHRHSSAQEDGTWQEPDREQR